MKIDSKKKHFPILTGNPKVARFDVHACIWFSCNYSSYQYSACSSSETLTSKEV